MESGYKRPFMGGGSLEAMRASLAALTSALPKKAEPLSQHHKWRAPSESGRSCDPNRTAVKLARRQNHNRMPRR